MRPVTSGVVQEGTDTMTRMILRGCFGLVLIAVALLLFLPENYSNSMWESYRRFRHDPGQIAFDSVRKNLADPESTRLLSFEKIIKDGAFSSSDTYLLRYATKNAYGEYGINEKFVKKDGSTDVQYYAERQSLKNKLSESGKVSNAGFP